jgi:hypothetical protein
MSESTPILCSIVGHLIAISRALTFYLDLVCLSIKLPKLYYYVKCHVQINLIEVKNLSLYIFLFV